MATTMQNNTSELVLPRNLTGHSIERRLCSTPRSLVFGMSGMGRSEAVGSMAASRTLNAVVDKRGLSAREGLQAGS